MRVNLLIETLILQIKRAHCSRDINSTAQKATPKQKSQSFLLPSGFSQGRFFAGRGWADEIVNITLPKAIGASNSARQHSGDTITLYAAVSERCYDPSARLMVHARFPYELMLPYKSLYFQINIGVHEAIHVRPRSFRQKKTSHPKLPWIMKNAEILGT